jgi:hypothetical protein
MNANLKLPVNDLTKVCPRGPFDVYDLEEERI